MIEIQPDLERAVKNNDLVIFAGAGLSMQFGFPDWKSLVKNVLERPNLKEGGFSGMSEGLDAGWVDPINALDSLKIYKTDIYQEVSKSFKLEKTRDFSRHKNILKLSSRIITTNFDKSFEYASDQQFDMIPYRSNFKISQLQGKEKYIFKIHGCIDYPEDCILFSKQYEEHYKESNTSIFELKKIVSENTILFIGFSMSDPFVKSVFEFVNSIYDGHTKKHFIITTDENLEKEIALSTIKSQVIGNYEDDFDAVIKKLLAIKELNVNETSVKPPKISDQNLKPSICILCPYPIEKTIEFNTGEIVNEFKNFDVIVDVEYLSIENIRELKSYDYILVFTQSLKNKMLIEDEFLKSKYISINSIEENIDVTNVKHISILYFGEILAIEESLNIPHVFVNLDKGKFKEILKSYIYKLFRKANSAIIQQSFICSHSKFDLQSLKRGKGSSNIHRPLISKYIDQKLLAKFVGRKTDLENIIRKIIENQFNTTLLTIKASGGIGKTTIICKAAIELANRKHFSNGIHFISCHSISTFENFYYQISDCFNLANSSELLSQIEENIVDKSRLIILDNFETLLNISESDKIIELVTFLIDYSTIVVTTRQLLELEFEDVYDLRNFTTEEGGLLFKTYYPNVKPEEEKILKEQIVEKILNNNPLAIKLIAKGLVKSKDLFQLKEELEEDIFKDEDLDKIFEKPEDSNIEKSVSLYQSINYSYQRLSEKEKLTFELLSLFPDGIHLENFKRFIKQSKNKKLGIGEKEIKSLDNKSLLENSNAFLKLQSIISRFADYQFMQKDEHLKQDFFTIALHYNQFFIDILDSNQIKSNLALKIQDENTNNYLKIIDHIELVDATVEVKLLFLNEVVRVFKLTNQKNEILKRVNRLYEYFEGIDDAELFIDSMLLLLEFWTTEFTQSLTELKIKIPIESLNDSFYANKIKEQTAYNAIAIYSHCGYQLGVLKHRLQSKECRAHIQSSLFQLGYIEETINLKDTFSKIFIFENKQIYNKLTLNEIDKYLRTCHPKDSIEIIQINYIKVKYFGDVSKKEIKKMVVSNPYTKGLISLMLAFVEEDVHQKKKYYIKGIELLESIKYYYVDALFNYCQFLKEINDSEYSYWIERGLKTAKEHHYRYLYHRLNIIKTGMEEEYFQHNYEQIIPHKQILSLVQKN